jgi:hypothetical protein
MHGDTLFVVKFVPLPIAPMQMKDLSRVRMQECRGASLARSTTGICQKHLITGELHMAKRTSTRRAGLLPGELEPGEDSHAPMKGDEATGSPAGGLEASGIAGLPDADGAPGNAELSETEDEDEPQSGRSGGAVGGTPVNKRARGH